MAIGKRMLVYSVHDPRATALLSATSEWGCLVTSCDSVDELRGKLEGTEYDLVVVEGSSSLRNMIGEADPEGEILRMPLAEIEKRHILRVPNSTEGNKTRAAKILGIDTKTLYNKLKAYGAGFQTARRRGGPNGNPRGGLSMAPRSHAITPHVVTSQAVTS